MDVKIESAQPYETVEAPQAEIPEWIKFAGNETGGLPAGIEEGTPIAIRLRQGTELAVFAGDSFDLTLGDWDHDDHEKDIVAYRLLSVKEAREFIGAQAVIEHVSPQLEKQLDHCTTVINDLKQQFGNPLFESLMPKIVATLRCPGGKYKSVTANATKSEAWLLQQVMPAFSEPPKD
ncbi:hypothetical protein ACL7TT_01230 [Microbulbifer sp. 2304DJ12-6]|uniref:hypothetical protein n=1 Tax=Microbulbifer sp. 2304DJ12-6 TaxID=3233340 RepID=UPI0039AF5653